MAMDANSLLAQLEAGSTTLDLSSSTGSLVNSMNDELSSHRQSMEKLNSPLRKVDEERMVPEKKVSEDPSHDEDDLRVLEAATARYQSTQVASKVEQRSGRQVRASVTALQASIEYEQLEKEIEQAEKEDDEASGGINEYEWGSQNLTDHVVKDHQNHASSSRRKSVSGNVPAKEDTGKVAPESSLKKKDEKNISYKDNQTDQPSEKDNEDPSALPVELQRLNAHNAHAHSAEDLANAVRALSNFGDDDDGNPSVVNQETTEPKEGTQRGRSKRSSKKNRRKKTSSSTSSLTPSRENEGSHGKKSRRRSRSPNPLRSKSEGSTQPYASSSVVAKKVLSRSDENEKPLTPKTARVPLNETGFADGEESQSSGGRSRSLSMNKTGRPEEVYATIKRRGPMGTAKQVEDYQLGEKLGKGAFGSVYKGLNVANGQFVAVKRLRRQGLNEEEIMSEVHMLKKLNHPNIVRYIGFIKTSKHLNVVLEYVEGGSLAKVLTSYGFFPESLAAIYLEQVLIGLRYLHSQNVIHRDIKGGNLLITKDGLVKLADFGIALVSQDDSKSSAGAQGTFQMVAGSPFWMAPEVIEMNVPTPACDIWSVGCTLIELLSGFPPYFDMVALSAVFKMVQDEHPPLPDDISQELEVFLLRCFTRDPTERPSAHDLLSDPWIRKYSKRPAPSVLTKGAEKSGSQGEETNPDEIEDVNVPAPSLEEMKGTLTKYNTLREKEYTERRALSAIEWEAPKDKDAGSSHSSDENQEAPDSAEPKGTPSPSRPDAGKVTDDGSQMPVSPAEDHKDASPNLPPGLELGEIKTDQEKQEEEAALAAKESARAEAAAAAAAASAAQKVKDEAEAAKRLQRRTRTEIQMKPRAANDDLRMPEEGTYTLSGRASRSIVGSLRRKKKKDPDPHHMPPVDPQVSGSIRGKKTSRRKNFNFKDLRNTFEDISTQQNWVILITGTETKRNILFQYTVYRCKVSTENKKTWIIWRTYNDFKALHAKLEKQLPSIKLPSLPPSKFFNAMDPAFVRQRKADLQRYIGCLAAIPSVCKSAAFHFFLNPSQ